MKTIWYSISDCQDPTRYQLEVSERFSERSAEAAAHDFHLNHDGWEARWPIDITLYETEDGPPISSFEVHREARPEFLAHRKERAA